MSPSSWCLRGPAGWWEIPCWWTVVSTAGFDKPPDRPIPEATTATGQTMRALRRGGTCSRGAGCDTIPRTKVTPP